MTAAEEKVKRLAKLKSNTICPNCGTEKKFGFGSVCIKFYTFVCNECKSSHQAISHRCKSTTMSSWTDEEVAELERKGNEYCLGTWLKHAPPCGQNGRPQPGSDLTVYKRFVVDAYENKRYFGNYDGPVSATVAVAAPQAQVAPWAAPPPRSAARTDFQRMKQVPAPASAPTPPLVDLLDFASPVSLTTTATPAPSTIDLFGDFTSAQSEAPTFDAFAVPSSQAPAPAANNDLFESLNQNSNTIPASLAPAPRSADFTGFTMPPATTTAAAGAPSTASDFSGLVAPTASTTKKPIMRSSAQSGVISMMSAVPPPVHQSYGHQMPPHQNTTRMQQQGGVMMNQNMSMMGGYNNPQMQQQFAMQQQMAMPMQQNQMNGFAMNQTGGGTIGHGFGGMNGVMHQFGGMSMNNGGMMVGGMNHGGMAHASFAVVPPQQQRQTMSDNVMPGGNVMDMLAYTQKKT
ncbi:hypothetical protein MHU86_21114 [Fragilaria crotonensis]|nr:hypothetical protein MHU86_21114 [Fragilaria crotonensis]